VLTTAESLATLSSAVPGTAFEDLNADGALERARAGVELAGRAGFACKRARRDAPTAWQGIVDVADEIDAAAIVIGSRGLNGVRELLRGKRLARRGRPCAKPVLIVPPPRRH
jgi:nucleotide-binding universal stress UspA family protein